MKKLSRSTRLRVCFKHQFLQGSWNFERMQNGGFAYLMQPALKELYPDTNDYEEALSRHLEFFNTHPYVSAPIVGIVLNLEEKRANGEAISDQKIHDVKVGLMGPLAGVGDPVFWFTMRPILAALGAALALNYSLAGPILFFLAWNILRFGFLWIVQELGYSKGEDLVLNLNDSFLKKVSSAACMLGMFVIGVLVSRYVNINVAGLQSTLDLIVPGLLGLCLFFFSSYVLKKGMSPVLLIVVLLVACIILYACGIFVI